MSHQVDQLNTSYYCSWPKPSSSNVVPSAAKAENGGDEDFDLFGSDDEEEVNAEKARITAERLKVS